MADKRIVEIPEYELQEHGLPVDFVLRTTDEIDARNGGVQDIPHRHNYYTILFIKHGAGKHVIDFLDYDILDHSIFFVSPGQVHQVLSSVGMSGYAILFTREFLVKHQIAESLITDIGLFSNIYNIPPIQVCESSIVKLERYICEIEVLSEGKGLFALESISAWLKLFFIECNLYASNLPEDVLAFSPKTKELIPAFKALVEKNFSICHKVVDYADVLKVTPDYLNSLVKTGVGQTAKEFIQNRIVLEAKRLGVHTSLSSKEIAFKLGFDDPAHFSKFFKTISGISFTNFRVLLVA